MFRTGTETAERDEDGKDPEAKTQTSYPSDPLWGRGCRLPTLVLFPDRRLEVGGLGPTNEDSATDVTYLPQDHRTGNERRSGHWTPSRQVPTESKGWTVQHKNPVRPLHVTVVTPWVFLECTPSPL